MTTPLRTRRFVTGQTTGMLTVLDADRYLPMTYVAGKFTGKTRGDVEQNIAAAVAVALEVARIGAFPVCPHANTSHPAFEELQPYTFWIDGTLELLRRCDAVVMVDNWRDSSGAKGEREEALKLGLPVFYSVSELGEWLLERGAA
jgi:hypothetical protein